MIHRWILEFESCHKLHLADASCELARKQAGHALERMQLSGIQCKVSSKSIPKVPSLPEKTSNLFLRLLCHFSTLCLFFFRGFRSSKTDNIFIQCNELQGTTTANSYFFGSARARLQGHQQVVILLSMVMLCYQAMETGPFGRHGSFTYYSTPQPEFGGGVGFSYPGTSNLPHGFCIIYARMIILIER